MRRVNMLLAIFISISLSAVPGRAASTTEELFANAIAPNRLAAAIAISELRRGGQKTLDEICELREQIIRILRKDEAATKRIDDAVDQVGGQRYCTASRLYWFTDFEAAKAAAAESGKPILSLRLLGKLTDELSCANSRFFRTTLYANREISDYLRSRYILHWESVRPVPKVTIDFGDGRELQCTIGGNSVHYILAANGQPIDALPGLYGPGAFLKHLRLAETAAQKYAESAPSERSSVLSDYHYGQLNSIFRAWHGDLVRLGIRPPGPADFGDSRLPKLLAAANAIDELEQATDLNIWKKIAELHKGQGELDLASKSLVSKQIGSAREASLQSQIQAAHEASSNAPTDVPNVPRPTGNLDLDFRKGGVHLPVENLMALNSFQSGVVLDTVTNEYIRHSRLHLWLADDKKHFADVQVLNELVYEYLFRMPVNDPWVGLIPPDTYTALEDGGIVRHVKKADSSKR